MLTLYNVVSSDGFIARMNGDEDFIPDEVWGDFLELLAEFDALLIGKNTYSMIQSFERELVEPFEKTSIKKYVVTKDINFVPNGNYIKVDTLQAAVSVAPNILLCSGPGLNTAFLKEGLIDQVILNKLSVSIGAGLRQFEAGIVPKLEPLQEPSRSTPDGRTLELYKVIKQDRSI